MRDDEPRSGAPGIDTEALEPPKFADAFAVNDVKRQTKLAFKLVLPLIRHRWWGSNDDEINSSPQQKLARNQASFNRFAKADIVSDQKIDAGQPQRLSQRQQLIGIESNACSERCLQEVPISGCGG